MVTHGVLIILITVTNFGHYSVDILIFENVIPLEDICQLAIVACRLSKHICTLLNWLHVGNMVASEWFKSKVTPH